MASDDASVEEIQAAGRETTLRTRRRDLIELSVGYVLILSVIWSQRPWQRVFYVAAVVFLAFVIWRGFGSWRAMGFRATNLVRSAWMVGVAAVLSALLVWLGREQGWMQRGHTARWFVAGYWGYAIWSLVQQVLLQDFFLRRVLRLLDGRRVAAVVVAAAVFALAHLPNPILTPLTLIWGSIACAAFLRYRNIWTLAAAHALLGITLSVTMPRPVVRNMRVGLGYLTFGQRRPLAKAMPAQRSQSDQTVSTRVWATEDAATRRSDRQARP
jgi:membrane protease YdiL (CAAX protease family)